MGAAIPPTRLLPKYKASGSKGRYDCRVAAALCRSLTTNHFTSKNSSGRFFVWGEERPPPPPAVEIQISGKAGTDKQTDAHASSMSYENMGLRG